MIFLTVGTQFPFDRLVKAINELVNCGVITDEVIAQAGYSSYKPKHLTTIDFCSPDEFRKLISSAELVISHAGMGAIAMALGNGKPLLVMPRLKKYGEVVNDHQLDIARKFEQDGYLLAAYGVGELSAKIVKLKAFVPEKRQAQAKAVAERISTFLLELSESKNKSRERL